MPHIIIEYSEPVIAEPDLGYLIDKMFETVEETGLFAPENIKIRAVPVKLFRLLREGTGFVHVQCRIHQGRDKEQKKHLTESIIKTLQLMVPEKAILTAEVVDMDTSSYAKAAVD